MVQHSRFAIRRGDGLLVCLLCLAAAALFVLVYLPNRKQHEAMKLEREVMRRRLTTLHVQANRLRKRCSALRAGDPEAVGEAMREVLRKDRPGGFVLGEGE